MSAINSATNQHVPGMISLEAVALPAHRGVGSFEMRRGFYLLSQTFVSKYTSGGYDGGKSMVKFRTRV